MHQDNSGGHATYALLAIGMIGRAYAWMGTSLHLYDKVTDVKFVNLMTVIALSIGAVKGIMDIIKKLRKKI